MALHWLTDRNSGVKGDEEVYEDVYVYCDSVGFHRFQASLSEVLTSASP